MTAPVLIYIINIIKSFTVHINASLFPFVVVLKLDKEWHEHHVTYCSCALSPAERNYNVIEW